MFVRWSSALRLNWDSALKITCLQWVTVHLARVWQKYNGYCVRSVVGVLMDVGSIYQHQPFVSEWFPLIPPDAWKVVNGVESMLGTSRGPTKYERNWEDVTAYGRERFKGSPRGISRGRRSRGRFRGASRFRGRGRGRYNPQNLNKSENESTSVVEDVTAEEDTHQDTESKDSVPVINNKEFPALPTKEAECAVEPLPERTTYLQNNSTEITENKSVRTLTFENSNLSGRNSLERDIPPRRGKTSPFRGSHERGSRKPIPRGSRGTGRGEYSRRGRGNMRHISPRFLENKVNALNSEMEHLSIEEVSNSCNDINSEVIRPGDTNGVLVNNLNGTEVSSIGLKGAGDSAGRPKRYSSLRQRSMPETTTYQTPQQAVPPPHAPYYDAGYQTALYAPSDTGVPTPSTQSQTVASPPIMNPSAYQTFGPTPYTDSYGIRLPVTTPPRLFPQVTVPAGQPILAPPPCITPSPSIMNFAPPPPPAGYHQFAYQQYATPPPPPPPAPPSDMFQTGITYYYPPSQPPPIRPTVQKRPKAAIPILPPPERETKKIDKQDSPQISSNRNFSDSSSDPVNVEMSSLRTEPSTQMQTSVGVES
ncbi:serine/arginine repetitive matrix protein 1-like [Stegodyphus dumicola]|uniref:serine/arginine repetitive matrix protein 1-like n=1 Tax=Stegodyphus dumicola TaxID=202533 RepID=UPI0015B2F5BE|nr:serine/arginine repetitive matrix protein 1-like [Stegodyphus dumicola]